MNTEPALTHPSGFEHRQGSLLASLSCGPQQCDTYTRRSARLDTRWGA